MTILFAAPVETSLYYRPISTIPTVKNGGDVFNPLYPPANLLSRDPTQVMQVLGTGTFEIKWDMGEMRQFDVVSLLSTTASPRAQMTIETSPDNSVWTMVRSAVQIWCSLAGQGDPGAGPYTEATDPRVNGKERNSSLFTSPTILQARYIRIVVNDPVVTTMSIGRLFVGKSWRPQNRFQYGSTLDFSDTGTKERTDLGSQLVRHGRSITGATVKMEFLTKEELNGEVYSFNYWRKSTGEILCCLDIADLPQLEKNLFYCTISEGRKVSYDYFNTHSQTWVLESI